MRTCCPSDASDGDKVEVGGPPAARGLSEGLARLRALLGGPSAASGEGGPDRESCPATAEAYAAAAGNTAAGADSSTARKRAAAARASGNRLFSQGEFAAAARCYTAALAALCPAHSNARASPGCGWWALDADAKRFSASGPAELTTSLLLSFSCFLFCGRWALDADAKRFSAAGLAERWLPCF